MYSHCIEKLWKMHTTAQVSRTFELSFSHTYHYLVKMTHGASWITKSWILLSRVTAASTLRSRNVQRSSITQPLRPHTPAAVADAAHSPKLVQQGASAGCSRSLVDHVGNPVNGVRHPVIDARLAALSARVAGRHDADQEPPVALLHHQGTARITLECKNFYYANDIIIRWWW